MASSASSSTSRGPVAAASRRRRLVLQRKRRDALQALFQQKPYPGIATRERLARELGIAESRIHVWFQNQRRRRSKQSRSPSEYVRQEGEGGPTCRPTPPSPNPRAQSSSQEDSAREARRKRTVISPSQTRILVQAFMRDRFPGIAAREDLARQTGIPEPRIQIWFQNRRARHPQQSPSGPGRASAATTPAPEGPRAPPAVQSVSPPLRPSQPRESVPPLAAAAPSGAPTFWVPATASGVCVGQPLMILMVQPSAGALRPSGKPPSPPQGAAPWAACCPAVTAPGQPGPGAMLPPVRPETHIPRWPESPYGEGTAPPLEPQPQAPHPSLPSSTSLLDELLAATGVPGSPGPSPRAAVVAAPQPALAATPSLLEEALAATGILPTPGPSLGPSANERAHLALPGSPSLQDELLAAPGIPGSPGPFLAASPVGPGAQPALPGSPSLLEEILAAAAIQDTPWSSPGAPAGAEGVEALLEAPLSEDDYQALLDMLPGSPGPGA